MGQNENSKYNDNKRLLIDNTLTNLTIDFELGMNNIKKRFKVPEI